MQATRNTYHHGGGSTARFSQTRASRPNRKVNFSIPAKRRRCLEVANDARQKSLSWLKHSIALSVGALCATLTFAQTLNPWYLHEMPSVERVMKDTQAGDPVETAARHMGAFLQLKKIIEDAAGPRFFSRTNGLTPDELRIRQDYYTAYYQISQSRPEYKALSAMRGYDISPQFRDELFHRYFSAAFLAEYQNANAAANARTQARLAADRAAAQASLAASGGVNPPRYAPPQASAAQPAAKISTFDRVAAEKWIREGTAAREKKDYSTAAADFQRAIAADPRVAESYVNLGLVYYELEQYEKAKEEFETYITLDTPDPKPDEPAAYILLGGSDEKLKKWAEAADAFRNAIRLNPEPGLLYKARGELGKMLYIAQDYPAAITELKAALGFKPDDPDAKEILHQAEEAEAKSKAGAGATTNSKTTAAPVGPGRREYQAGNAALDQKDYRSAIANYQRAVALDPKFANAYLGLGIAFYDIDQFNNAGQALQHAVSLKPDDPDTRYWLGRTDYSLKEYEQAAANLREAVRLNPADAGSWSYLGLTYYFTFQFPQAEQAIQQELRLEPNEPSLYLLGLVYVQVGKKAEALDVYKRLLTADKDDAQKLSEAISKLK
jgi:tetratricopeptide (TPR) repeat protein